MLCNEILIVFDFSDTLHSNSGYFAGLKSVDDTLRLTNVTIFDHFHMEWYAVLPQRLRGFQIFPPTRQS